MLYRSGMAFELVSSPAERSMMLLTRPGRAAPSLIEAMARLDDLGLTLSFHVRVDPGGTIRVAALTIHPTGSPADGAITARALRGIRLDQLARAAVRQQEQPASMLPDVGLGAFQVPGDPADQAWVSPVPGRRRAPREKAEEAARIYIKAVASGSKAPTMAVANELGYSRSQASRLVRAARDAGLLDQAQAAPAGPPSTEKPEPDLSIFRDPAEPWPAFPRLTRSTGEDE